MKNYKFKINGNDYSVDIISNEDNKVALEVNGTPYTVELEKEAKVASKTPKVVRTAAISKSQEAAPIQASGKLNRVTAPLPGTILHLKLVVGAPIKKGEVLMIMEAMKMENNILSEADGVIKSILVREGQNVLQGDVLVEIE
ncbi:MAG: biotin/lipoyl-containing protein [Cyclobacteriaceae bacterium]